MFSAKEENLHKIFGETRYSVPYYQRPYSWEEENAAQLWDDLFNAWETEGHQGAGYFLGSVVLVSKQNDEREDIVDGQQRFVTLQLLLAALASHVQQEDTKRRLTRYVISEADEFANTRSELVVTPGERYRSLFEAVITSNETEPDNQRNSFFLNWRYFERRAAALSQEQIIEFAKFVVQKAFLAVLRADTEVQALRIFTVLNDRGIDLHPVDILKARLLEQSNLPESHKVRLAHRWEEYEERFERQRFQDLILHIRMTFIRGRTQLPLHEDMLRQLPDARQAELFLKERLPEFADAFDEIESPSIPQMRDLVEIGRRSRFKDWEAPTLFLVKNRSAFHNFLYLLKRISAIVAFMAVTKMPDGQRAGRFGRIIDELDQATRTRTEVEAMPALNLSNSEWQAFKSSLEGDAYSIRGIKAFLVWLETISGDSERAVTSNEVTVEHLLPRTVGDEECWRVKFNESTWIENANRIGNLLLVSGRSNSKMGRKCFDEKKRYINSKGGSHWTWTARALTEDDWTPSAILSREREIFEASRSAFSMA